MVTGSAAGAPWGIDLTAALGHALISLKSSTWNKPLVNNIIGTADASVSPQVQTLRVDEESAGQRLDNFLIRHLKGVPKTHIYRIIRSGEVRVNKGRASPDTRLAADDAVRLPPVRVSARALDKAQAIVPERDFAVMLEDAHLIAVNKPAGLAVHGGSGVSFGVIEQIRQSMPHASEFELVHRLDRETSGILLVAKKRSALKHLQTQFRERSTDKTYLALVRGIWPQRQKVIDLPLQKFLLTNGDGSEGERRVRVVAPHDPQGMRAITLVKVARLLGDYTLLEVTIKTGRTHQIRVHLASLGHPILGDDKYGDYDLNKALQKTGLRRMFLHAWKLQFRHPASGELVALNAPLPPELQSFIDHVAPPTPPV